MLGKCCQPIRRGQSMSMSRNENDLLPADDLLDGVRAIAAFTGFSRRRCFYLLQKGLLPAGKIGARWLGSKRAIRERLSRIAAEDND